MIYTHLCLEDMFKGYSNINQKIAREVRARHLEKIKRGLYSDNVEVDAPLLANICLSPSYLSFEYALSFYGLIPEKVSVLTSASFKKKNRKIFESEKLSLSYVPIPERVFHKGVIYLENDDHIRYKMATKEKALCDTLYSQYPVRSVKDLKILLFENLRINESEFAKLDFLFLLEICPDYQANSLNALYRYIKKEFLHEPN